MSAPKYLRELVEDVFLDLVRDPEFRAYLTGKDETDTVEGNVETDTLMAALQVREKAPEGSPLRDNGIKLAAIYEVLVEIMPRYGFHRVNLSLDDMDALGELDELDDR